MSTAEERYALAAKITQDLTQLRNDFKDVGMFTEIEHKAISTLLVSASIAMNILDPEKYLVYVEQFNSQSAVTRPDVMVDLDKHKTGQYL